LTTAERRLLDFLVSANLAGFEVLREQARRALVVVADPPRYVRLSVPGECPPANVPEPVPVWAYTDLAKPNGVDVTLWVMGGYLRAMEVSWYEDPPARYPTPEELNAPEDFTARGKS
jgi:hypothetical protein